MEQRGQSELVPGHDAPEEEDIAAWQADWNIPPSELDDVVKRAIGSGVATDERILEGHGNEVHGVVTGDGHEVVVRIAWRPGPVFESEWWPIQAARDAGLAAPEVLLVDHGCLAGRPVSIQVQRRLPGRSLFRLFPHLPDAVLLRLTRQAGQLLAALHSIRTRAPGFVGPDGRVDEGSRPRGDAVVAAVERGLDFLIANGCDRGLLEAATDAVVGGAELLNRAPVTLVHGDWRTTNVLSDGTSITGIVDWEGARGGDPAFDFVVWSVRSRDHATATEALVGAYREAGGSTDGDFDLRRRLYLIADRLSALGHFTVTGRPELLAIARADLRSALDEFVVGGSAP
jgi:aminoglycoside phosphotransferase (APT) family kinase protein